MKRQIIVATTPEAYTLVSQRLSDGWVLDPTIHRGEPFGLEASIVYHLVLYESEDEKPKPEEKLGDFNGVTSLKDVPNAEVDALLEQGYIIHTVYAKNTILLKRKDTTIEEAEKS